jgi:RND family efflux transporter MFP subunit
MNDARAAAPRTATRTVVLVALGVLAVFVLISVAGAASRIRRSRGLDASVTDSQRTPPTVYVITAGPASESGLTLAATTQAIQDAIIYARTSGYVSKRHVDIGDRVRPQQLLAEIESPEVEQQLQQSLSDLRQSEKNLDLQNASLELAGVTMERFKAADRERAVAIEAVDQSVSAFRTAQAAVAAAEANVASNRANVQRLRELTGFQRVLAPFDGIVIQRNVDVGALITAGSPTDNTAVAPSSVGGAPSGLFEVAQVDKLRVFVNVPQAFASNVRAGLPVTVVARGHLETPVSASVTRTAGALDPGTRTLLAQVEIPNAAHVLLPGMFVYVSFKIAPSGIRWHLPATALIVDAQGTRVAVVGPGNVLTFRQVVPGRDFGDAIDIQAGLHGGESIVVQPTVDLEEGQRVRPLAFKPKS